MIDYMQAWNIQKPEVVEDAAERERRKRPVAGHLPAAVYRLRGVDSSRDGGVRPLSNNS